MLGPDIVASEATRAQAPGYAWLEIDRVVFKNKTRPVGVYALAGDEAFAETAEFGELAAEHERMLAHYRRGEFAEARTAARALEPQAPASIRALYRFNARRFDELAAQGAPRDWEAVLALEEK
jgi:adenylate cyclase